jgi:hypothetical protein
VTTEAAGERPTWPPASELGRESRSLVFQAFARMPEVFLGVTVAYVALIAAEAIARLDPGGFAWLHNDLAKQLVHFISVAFSIFVSACAAVTIHRFILLRETTRGLGPIWHRYTWRFAFWGIALSFGIVLRLLHAPLLLRVVLEIPLVVIALRLSLLFPAVAIGAPTGTIAERLTTSWLRTRGRVFYLLYAYIEAIVPAIVIGLLLFLALLIAENVWSWYDIVPNPGVLHAGTAAFALVGFPALQVFGVSCAAAVASCAYRAAAEADIDHMSG